jgi:hypothetical protein
MELPITVEDLRTLGIAVAIWVGVCLTLALLLFIFVVRKIRRLDIPAGATLSETLHAVPFALVAFIDLLDLGLDVFAVPFTWVVLDRLNLRALRNVSALEALVPFTGPIPTLTLAWVWVRLFGGTLPLPDESGKRRIT